MACIHKLNKAISFGCTGGQAGIEALYLVNRGDIKSLTRDYTGAVTDIVLDNYPGDANNLLVNGRRTITGAGRAEYSLVGSFIGNNTGVISFSVSVSGATAGAVTVMGVGGTGLANITLSGTSGVYSVVNSPVSGVAWTENCLSLSGESTFVYDWAVLVEGPNTPTLPHSIPVDCYRNGVKLIETLRTADIGDRLEQTLSITLYNKADTDTLTKLVNGSFVAFVKMKELGAIYAVGLNNGLEISSADMDSSANGGFTAVSLKTPEGCVGEQRVMCSKTAWDKVVTFSI